MRGLIAAVCLGLGALSAAGAASAAQEPLSAEGRCDFEIAAGVVGAGDHCSRLTLKENPTSGEMILTFHFPSGMVVEMEGPAMQVADWRMMSPARISWTNAGGKPQQMSNPAREPNPQVTGRCAVYLPAAGTQLSETHCRLQTPLGDISIAFKVPKAEKAKD